MVKSGHSREAEESAAPATTATPRPPSCWLIEPVASPDDSRWQDRPIWRRVLVMADSPAFARLTAEAWALPRVPPQIGNESDSPRAGFLDEKLYLVRQVPSEAGRRTPQRPDWDQVIEAELLRGPPDIIET